MRRPSVRLLLALAVLFLAMSASVHAQSAKDKLAPVIPHYDPPDQPFRMAPMPQSTRSIVVPLATNLHLAFDTALLRTHTVWSGKGLALLGPQYGLPKAPFISTNDGTVLWTMPPVFPWAVGKMPEKDEVKPPAGWVFHHFAGYPDRVAARARRGDSWFEYYPERLGIQLGIEVSRDHRINISEGFSRAPYSTNGVIRTFHTSRLEEDLWFLAHAEMGHAEIIEGPTTGALIEREFDVLTVRLQPPSEGGIRLVAMDKMVDYEVEIVTEQGAEKGHPKHRMSGKQGRLYVQIANPANTRSVFILRTDVFPSKAAALTWLKTPVPTQQSKSDGIKEVLATLKAELEDAKSKKAQKTPPSSSLSGGPMIRPSQVSTPHFRAEAFPLPQTSNFTITGMAFLPGGNLVVCTWAGEVWVVEGAQGLPKAAKYRRVAQGLCEPMGVVCLGNELYVGTKQGLYLFSLPTTDAPTDHFQCVSQAWGYTGGYNSFVYGPVFDKAGNFMLANAGHSGRWDSAYMGWAMRISPDGQKLEPICSGLREPNGIGTFGPDREVFVSENQGQWMAACKLNHVTPGKFYGHPSAWPAPQEEYGKHTRFDPPAVWFPYKLARSVTGFVEITDDRFGPFKGQLMVGDFQNAIVTRVQLEKVNGEYQGAVWPFLKQFQSGVNRLAYGPDGKLYVGGLQAPRSWTAVAPLNASLERIEFTGKMPFEVKEVHARPDGFELTFTQPVEEKAAANPDSYDVTQYGFKYHAKYGSPELDHDGKENAATVIKIAGATVSPDKLKVRLKLEGWKTGYVTMVRSLDVKNGAGESLVNDTFWYTLNQLPK